MIKHLTVPALFTVLLSLSACRKGDPSWETGLVFPIAHAEMTIDKLVPDSFLSVNADGSVRLVYSTDFLGLDADTIFHIPDTTIVSEYHSPFNLNLTPGQFLANTPSQTAFAVTNAQLVFANLISGQMVVLLKNDITRRVIIQYQIPSATLNGIPFDTSFLVDAAPDNTHSYYRTAVIDLSGYNIDFTGTNHDRVNTITSILSSQIDPLETGNASVTPADTVAAYITYTGIHPYYVRGYFGNQTINIGPEETPFNIFRKVRSGSIGLDSLTMTLHLNNYIGMDSRITINDIWSRNSRNGNSVHLNHSLIGTPVNINRGMLTNSNPPVTPDSHTWIFDNSNSNAKALVENLPDQLGYNVTLITNPMGNISMNNDFLFDQYDIKAKLDVEMPLNFFADQLVIADTTTTDFSAIHNRENIKRGTLTLHAQNQFPFEANVQIYIVDQNNAVIDSIVSAPGTILAGISSAANGYLVSSGYTLSQIDIPLDEVQTQLLLNSARIIIKATFDTHTSPGFVKIYNTNRLDLQLTADFDYLVN